MYNIYNNYKLLLIGQIVERWVEEKCSGANL